ncbi:hypothetical protein LCGC14_2478030, partial [marine sediment metagenome]
LLRGYVESISRQEVRATRGLFEGTQGMTTQENQLVRLIEEVGLRDHVPRLISLLRSARTLEKGNKQFKQRIKKITGRRNLPEEFPPEFPPELADQLRRLDKLSKEGVPDSFEGILEAYGASNEEKLIIMQLDKLGRLSKDDFSSFVVSRYLMAPELKPGFKTIKEQYIAENALNAQEVRAAQEVEKMLEAAFAESGLSARRQIAGYWSHARVWSEFGLTPDSFMERMIPKRSVEWSANRFRSGELNVYETDPVFMANKYTRGLFMKRHVDPVLKVANKELKRMRGIDAGTHRVMSEYINEIMGAQHTTFTRIDATLASFLKSTGVNPTRAKGLSAKITNEFTGLAYKAAIPFRPVNILRNFFQQVQMIPPRVGFKHYYKGLEKAFTKEGYEEAVRRNIIPADIIPVHASAEVLPAELNKALKPLGLKYQRIFDAGFRWYKYPDDIGRTAAFHSIKSRINAHIVDYETGKITWEVFKSRAKINTFDSNDIAEFTRILNTENSTEAAA